MEAEILRSYLIIVLLPGLGMFAALKLANVKSTIAFMLACITMAVVAVFLLVSVHPWTVR